MLAFQFIVDGLVVGAAYSLLALGFSLIYNVAGVLNVAHTAVYMLGAYAAAMVGNTIAEGIGRLGASLVSAIIVSGVTGLILYLAVLRRFRTDQHMSAFIATIGATFVLEYGVARVMGPEEEPAPALVTARYYDVGGVAVGTTQMLVLAVTVLLGSATFWWIYRTQSGREIRAVAEDETGAAIVAINVHRVKMTVMIVSSAMAGVAGALLASLYGSYGPFMGTSLALTMFIVVLVAGLGSVVGPAVIGVMLGIVQSLTIGYVGSEWRDLVGLVVLILVLISKPGGVFGKTARMG